jgi:hypothetical protein
MIIGDERKGIKIVKAEIMRDYTLNIGKSDNCDSR